jgi:hypothetical protein
MSPDESSIEVPDTIGPPPSPDECIRQVPVLRDPDCGRSDRPLMSASNVSMSSACQTQFDRDDESHKVRKAFDINDQAFQAMT